MRKNQTITEIPRLDANWTRHLSVLANGITFARGDRLKVKNQPGTYVMHEFVDTGKHQWMAVHQDGTARSFRLTDILKSGKVHK